jgi:hypothetical protein
MIGHLIVANLKKTIVLAMATGMVIGFIKALDLSEEQKRRIKKAMFELKELPRRILI